MTSTPFESSIAGDIANAEFQETEAPPEDFGGDLIGPGGLAGDIANPEYEESTEPGGLGDAIDDLLGGDEGEPGSWTDTAPGEDPGGLGDAIGDLIGGEGEPGGWTDTEPGGGGDAIGDLLGGEEDSGGGLGEAIEDLLGEETPAEEADNEWTSMFEDAPATEDSEEGFEELVVEEEEVEEAEEEVDPSAWDG